MDLLPSAEQRELTSAAAEFFTEQIPISAIRERRDEPAAIAGKLWAAGAELGLLGLSAPESVGGSGRDLPDEALLFREVGRALVPGPFVASVLGARVAALRGQNDLAESIVDGRCVVGVALLDGSRLTPERLTGRIRLLDAAGAGHVLVVSADGAGLVETAALTDLMPLESIDPGSRLAVASADGAPVTCWVGADRNEAEENESIQLRGALLAAAQLVGVAEGALRLAVEHAKTRVQFGRPIGVHQAIKHRCADMAVAADAALQQTLFAAICLESGRADAVFQTRAAKVIAGRAAIDNSAECIQIHGGMGYTYEHDAHLFLKRAHVLDQLFGSRTDLLKPLLAEEAAQ